MEKEKKTRVLTETQVERRKAIKDFLKSLIFPTVLLAIIVGLLITAKEMTTTTEVEDPIIPYKYEGGNDPIILENSNIKFTLDPKTTQFTVEKKSTGKIWYSNPQDVDADGVASSQEKDRLKSTVLLTYGIQNGGTTMYDSYGFSVKNGVYQITQNDSNSVTIDYSMGKIQKEYTIPPVAIESKFEEWCSKMEAKGSDLAKSYYKKYDINKLKKTDDKDQLLADYPIMESEVIWVLRDTTKENTRRDLEKYFAAAGYTYEDYQADCELSSKTSTSDVAIFNVSVTYRLDGDDLVVEVPFNKFECLSKYNVYEVTILPYLGAGGVNDEGFSLIPEGGGAIINFNNGKVKQNQYYADMYGWDRCLSKDDVVHITNVTYGCFGISDNANSFIRLPEEGAPYCSVQADISGKLNSYNYVNSVYSLKQREKFDVGNISSSDVYKYLPELPDEKITERIRFVDGGDYVDMAKEYGKYLFDNNPDSFKAKNDTSAPVVVELVGAVDKTSQILGIPVKRPLPLTTFDEATTIVNELYNSGFKNLYVKYLGWCNGGVTQKILDDVSVIGSLGGKSDLKDFISATDKLDGVNVYLNGITQYAYDSDLFDGFFSFTDAAKFISKERAELFQFSGVTYAAREGVDSYFLLHTEIALEIAQNFADYCKEMGVGVAFEDNGCDLSSDFYEDNTYSRYAVLLKQKEQFNNLYKSGQKVMINEGNDYALPYVDIVANMDLTGSKDTIVDKCVPFLQLALHGRLDYVGKPLNICGNLQDELLECAEYGAGLNFSFMAEDPFTLQNTLYQMYYGSDYSVWGAKATDIYTEYNNALGHTFALEMTDHEKVSDKVSCTKYADGTKVFVNYSYTDFTTSDGISIPARSYKVVR